MSEITSERRAVATLSAYVDQLLTDECTDELNNSENKRRAFFAFVFGGIGGLAIQEGLTPQEAQSVAIGVFCETLRLSPMDSAGWPSLGSTPRRETRSGRTRRARGSTNFWRGKPILTPSRRRTYAWCSIVCRLTVPRRDDMTHLVSFDFLQLLATIFLGVVGIVFTVLQARNARRQNTLKLYEKWDAQELSQYRSVVWDVWKNLKDGKDEAVICWLGGDYFGMSIQEIDQRIPEEHTHAVRSLLNYFASVYEYQKLGLTDRKVTDAAFPGAMAMVGRPFHTLEQKGRKPFENQRSTRKRVGGVFLCHDFESRCRPGPSYPPTVIVSGRLALTRGFPPPDDQPCEADADQREGEARGFRHGGGGGSDESDVGESPVP